MNTETSFNLDFVEITRQLGRYDDTEEQTAELLRFLNLPEGANILDIPCGFGRFSHELWKAGFKVTGVDASPEQIEVAKQSYAGPDYLVGDMTNPPPGPFDAVLNLYTSFGYYDDKADDVRALAAWHSVLGPGGVLVIETADLERAEFRLGKGGGELRHVTGEVVEYISVDWATNILAVNYQYRGKTILCRVRLYDKNELSRILKDVGFSSVELFGGFDGRPKAASDHLVVRATR